MNLRQFLSTPFTALDLRKHRWVLASVTGIYGILFMHLYVPFNVKNWPQPTIELPMDIFLSAFGVLAWIYLIITQVVGREIIRFKTFTNLHFAIWTLLELIVMSVLLLLLFGETYKTGLDLVNEYWLVVKQTLLVGVVPYGSVVSYYQLSQRKVKVTAKGEHLVKFPDSNGDIKLVVDLTEILFIKSADNYVEIHYLKDDVVKKELIRTTLKSLDEQLSHLPIRRCQRSFMVNINRVVVLQKNSQGFNIELKGYPSPIPVSKNYKQYFIDLLEEHSA